MKLSDLSKVAKAIAAFAAPELTDIAVTLQLPGPLKWAALGRRAVVYFLGAVVVWAVPNAKPEPTVAAQVDVNVPAV